MSDNEYDNLSDDIADLDGVDWDRLLSAPAPNRRTPQREPEAAAEAHIRGTGGSTPSSIYFDDESLDETAFAELDAIEQRYTQQAAGSSSRQSLDRVAGPSSGVTRNHVAPSSPRNEQSRVHFQSRTSLPTSDLSHAEAAPSCHDSLKRFRSASPASSTQPSKKKGKVKGDEYNVDSTRPSSLSLLEQMEDEYTCSVCCDILAAAHIANPCGHSFCGDCGYQWVSVAKKSTCPICRTHLSVSAQLIPNVALESAVGKYVELLGVAGHNGWRSGGNLHKDWLERKEMWKIQALAREKKHPPEDQPGTNVQQVIDLTRVFFDRSSPIRDDGSDLIPVAPPTYRSHRPFARTRSSRAVLLPNI